MMCDLKLGSCLPYYLTKSVTSYVQIESSVVDSAPDIAICKSDGYMYEIKAKKIVNSLNLNGELGEQISCVYLVENDKIFLSYLVLTSTGKLFIIYNKDSRLEVNKVYEQVQSFQVYDFMNLGYPQINISYLGSKSEYPIVKFSVNDTKTVLDEAEDETNLHSLSKSLAEKLQIICRHVDELKEEWCSIKNLCQLKINTENFGLLPADSVQFSTPCEKSDESITVISKWIKIISGKLILGIKFRNDGEKAIYDLNYHISEKSIVEYSYKFFSSWDKTTQPLQNLLFANEVMSSSIQPNQEMTVVGAVSISHLNLPFKTKLQISCYLSANIKNFIIQETFTVAISDVLYFGNNFFSLLEENCTVEDLQAIKTAKFETKLRVETKNVKIDCMKTILEKNFKFTCVKGKGNMLYFCTSAYLKEVFVAIQLTKINEPIWKIILYTSDESEIYFIVNMLYELLPEYTTIILDE